MADRLRALAIRRARQAGAWRSRLDAFALRRALVSGYGWGETRDARPQTISILGRARRGTACERVDHKKNCQGEAKAHSIQLMGRPTLERRARLWSSARQMPAIEAQARGLACGATIARRRSGDDRSSFFFFSLASDRISDPAAWARDGFLERLGARGERSLGARQPPHRGAHGNCFVFFSLAIGSGQAADVEIGSACSVE
jgi:hypothetical protein